MKRFLLCISLITFLYSCQKGASPNIKSAAVVSDNALMPLKYHAVSFTTNYKTEPGKCPPFSFTKTLYPDTRVQTLKMISRALPNYPTYKQQAYDWDVKFYYSLNASHMTGTRKLIEYSIDPVSKAGVSKVLQTENLSWDFRFSQNNLCDSVLANGELICQPEYGFSEDGKGDTTLYNLYLPARESIILYYFIPADPTNPVFTTFTPYNRWVPLVEVTYQPGYNGKTEFYQPTQYALDQAYSLLEVMQWAPCPKRERKSVKLDFWTSLSDASHVVQKQSYYNHVYDKNGCLTSYSYGDNVQQKITWK